MSVEVRLLGRPSVTVDGDAAAPPRGAKAWGVLAYLALSRRRHPRSELAALLFGEADDPLGALRWNLAALRRLLGSADVLKGDELGLELPADARVDVWLVEEGSPDALDEPGLGLDLLDGLAFSGAPAFETWLVGARRRLARRAASLLREATLSAIARGDYDTAVDHATRLVQTDPLDEANHALVIRAHAVAGDAEAAEQQLERCRDVLRRELDVEPGAAVLAAARAAPISRSRRDGAPEIVEARLAVAWQSFLGGAIDHSIDVGRAAVAMSDACDDDGVRVFTRTYFGAMLAMAVRGWDEAATALTEAIVIADEAGLRAEGATAHGVVAGVHMMAGDYDRAAAHAQTGFDLSDDVGARSVNLMFLAAVGADTGHVAEAMVHGKEAVSAARTFGDPVRLLYACGHAGRVALMHGHLDVARALVTEACTIGAGTMLALQPWPLVMLAEIEIAEGDVASAVLRARQAAALAATTEIVYQEALAHRASGLAAAATGDTDTAVAKLQEALVLARRTTGEGYLFHWPVAFILDSLSTVTAATDTPGSHRWADALEEQASAIGMHTMVERARERLGSQQ